jgi:hypothetical protein
MRLGLPLYFLVLSTLLTSLGTFASPTFDKHTKREHRRIIKADLEALQNWDFALSTLDKTGNLFLADQVTGKSVSEWLHKRVHYFVNQKPLVEQKFNRQWRSSQEEVLLQKTTAPLANFSAALYKIHEQSKTPLRVKISLNFWNNRNVIIDSSEERSGIILWSERLFEFPTVVNRVRKNSIANRISRLSSYIHEARHTDQGGFLHVECPVGHDLAGRLACDDQMDGSYAYQAQILKEFIRNCHQCEDAELERLKLKLYDAITRRVSDQTKLSQSEKEL